MPRAKPKRRVTVNREGVSAELSVAAEGIEPILGAAYLMTDRAHVFLAGDRKRTARVLLRPKDAPSAKALRGLAAAFEAELDTQRLRWAIAKNNLPIQEYVAEQAVLLANGRAAPAAEAAGDELTPEQRQEIDKLIAEVEEEIKQINDRKAPAAAKKTALPWEATRKGAAGDAGP